MFIGFQLEQWNAIERAVDRKFSRIKAEVRLLLHKLLKVTFPSFSIEKTRGRAVLVHIKDPFDPRTIFMKYEYLRMGVQDVQIPPSCRETLNW